MNIGHFARINDNAFIVEIKEEVSFSGVSNNNVVFSPGQIHIHNIANPISGVLTRLEQSGSASGTNNIV